MKAISYHELLSQSLVGIATADNSPEGFTINELIGRTEGRGLYLVMILLSLPFISPIPVPGLSNIVGIVIMFLAIQLALKHQPRLPKILGEKRFPAPKIHKVIRATAKWLRFLEKLAYPRCSNLLSLSSIRWINAVAFFVMGVLLALPIPPVVPFSNSLPSWGIILIALATMERDGVMIWIGYAAAIGAFAYLALIAGVSVTSFEQVLRFVQTLFHTGL